MDKAWQLIGGKWTVPILCELFTGTKRFGELLHSLAGISPKTLSERLKCLEIEGIVARTAYPEVPPRVEYTLTEKGHGLNVVLEVIRVWEVEWDNKDQPS